MNDVKLDKLAYLKYNKTLNQLIHPELMELLYEYTKEYKNIFGYTPDREDYDCTQEEYVNAMLKSIREKKDLFEYLDYCPMVLLEASCLHNHIEPAHRLYKKIFGYTLRMEDFSCGDITYQNALFDSIRNKKEITEYLKKNKNPFTLNQLTYSEFMDLLHEYNEKYKNIFGYTPNREDYLCTQEEYANALLKSIKNKKEISEYLKEDGREN